jgi:squalene cyclase
LALATSDREPLERAADALQASQHEDGGWGYHSGVPTDADSTACALLFLAVLGRKDLCVERASACLARHQDADSGGLATYREPGPIRRFMGLGAESDLGGWCASHVEVTATAGRAFAASARTPPGADADSAWRYVCTRQREDGSWASYWWTTHHYPTLQAVALASDVGDHAAVQRAAAWALRGQEEDGGWSAPDVATSAFATAMSLSVLLRAGERGPQVDRAVERLLALQESDGGWPSHPVMRIPPPGLAEPDRQEAWRIDGLGTGVVVRDQHRTFTTAACVGALALASSRSS